MSWYRAGTVAVTNGSKTVTGVGTLWTTAVNVGDAFSLVDANLNPTGAWYEVDVVVSNTEITLKQSYAGSTGSNNQYCVFNMVGNMTTPSFAQRLATFFASFQSLIDKPTTTPTAASIPVADANGDIDSGWIKDASATVKGVVELATNAEVIQGTDTERAVTPAGLLAGFPTRLRSNLLGTVSQTGGIPTGAVIERGSNANGSYVKFADGTLLMSCIMIALATNNGSTGTNFTLPIGLSTIVGSVAAVSIGHTSGGLGARIIEIQKTSTTIFNAKVMTITSTGALQVAEDVALNIFVYGRWF